jgi:hypothetical protein
MEIRGKLSVAVDTSEDRSLRDRCSWPLSLQSECSGGPLSLVPTKAGSVVVERSSPPGRRAAGELLSVSECNPGERLSAVL